MKHAVRKASMFFIMAAMMIVSIAGCSGTSSQSNEPAPSTAPPAQQSAPPAQEVQGPPIELTVLDASGGSPSFSTGDPIFDDNPIAKYVLENLNIKLKREVLSGDGAQAMGLKLAAGDYADIIIGLTPDVYQKMLDDNRLIALESLIDAAGPNIKTAYGESTLNFLKADDGHLYRLTRGYGNIPEGSTPAGYGNGFQLRKDIYEALGSPSIETTDDVYDVLKRVQADPVLNTSFNGESVWPIGTFKRSWLNFMQALITMGGAGTAKWTEENGNIQYWFREPWAETAILFYNKLYREGLLDPDSFVVEPGAWQTNKVYTGRIASTIGAWYMVADAWGEFRNANVDNAENMYYMNFAVRVPGGDKPQLVNISSVGNGYTVITDKADAQKQEAAMKLLDFFASAEGNFMVLNGPEGVMWEMQGGVPALKPEFLERWRNGEPDESFSKEVGVQLYRGFVSSDVSKSPWGTYMVLKDDPSVTGRVDFAQRDEALGSYFFDSAPFSGIESGLPEDVMMIYTTIEGKFQDALYKPVMAGSEDAARQEWAAFVKSMDDLGAERVETEVSKNYQGNLKKLNK